MMLGNKCWFPDVICRKKGIQKWSIGCLSYPLLVIYNYYKNYQEIRSYCLILPEVTRYYCFFSITAEINIKDGHPFLEHIYKCNISFENTILSIHKDGLWYL